MTVIPLYQNDEVFYPESDSRPMGESDLHRDEITALIFALQNHFEAAAEVYVTGNLFLYYRRGDPGAVVCPDVCVIPGAGQEDRRKYLLWQERRLPTLVIEVTSASTSNEDLVGKKDLYARLGVQEYILHDPLGETLRPALQGFRLETGQYRPIRFEPDGTLRSEAVGLLLRREGPHLRLVNPATGEPLRRPKESEAERKALQEEVARLRQELARTRG
jgi:Uma2 family endonuclease